MTLTAASSAHDETRTRASLAEQTLRQRRSKRRLEIMLGAATPVVLLVVWQLLVFFGMIDRRFFPPPTTIISSAIDLLMTPGEFAGLATDVAATLRRLFLGYTLGAAAGITMGVAMGLYGPIRAAFAPTIFATFPTPKIAIFPLMLVIFGIGDASKIALVTLGVFFMTCINTLSGVTHAAPIYRDVVKAFRMPRATAWFRVVVPSALPSIIAGLRLALGQALILVVASEFVAANSGLGQFIWNSWQSLDIAKMFLGLSIAALIGVSAMFFGNFLERHFVPWAKH